MARGFMESTQLTNLREVEAVPVAEAVRLSGISRSSLYRLLAAGDIKAIKIGRSTLIVAASLRAYLEAAPPAEFRRADVPGRAA